MQRKLLDWAQRKLLHKQKLNPAADRHCAGILNDKVPDRSFDADPETNIASNSGSEHVEILTIGTLGMGDVLSMHRANDEESEPEDGTGDQDQEEDCDSDGIQEEIEYIYEEEEEDNDDDDDDDNDEAKQGQTEEIAMTKEAQEQIADQTSLINCDPTTVNQYVNPGSPTRASVSSINRASISSVDIQKLQEELQKILYFKLVPNSNNKSGSNTSSTNNIDGKRKKKNNKKDSKHSSNTSDNQVALKKNTSSGRSIHMQGSFGRGAFPLHNFLEIPMDGLPPATSSFIQKNQWLLHSIRSKVLHCVSPKNIRLPHFLAEKLIKSKARSGSMDQHGVGKMDKMMQILRRMQGSKAAATAAAKRRVSSSCRKSIGDGSQRHQHGAAGGGEDNDDLEEDEDGGIYGERIRKLRRQDSSERFIQYMNKMAEHQQQQQAAAAAAAARHSSSSSTSASTTLRSSTSSTTSTASTSTTLTAGTSSSSAACGTVIVHGEAGNKSKDNDICAASPSSSPSSSPTSSCSSDDGNNTGRHRCCRHRHQRRHRRHADVGGMMGCWINTDDEYLVLEL